MNLPAIRIIEGTHNFYFSLVFKVFENFALLANCFNSIANIELRDFLDEFVIPGIADSRGLSCSNCRLNLTKQPCQIAHLNSITGAFDRAAISMAQHDNDSGAKRF